MGKVNLAFVIKQYQSGIDSYKEATLTFGLWDSEKYVFEKYLRKDFSILDLGCGTGRTTFGLYKMGYTNISGVDITPEMIETARVINNSLSLSISFAEGDATALQFGNEAFDAVIFSFNGIMSIPGATNRLKAFSEIHRVLKRNGTFIFTTHDRDADVKFFDFWKEEKQKWEEGRQNPALIDFGDVITTSRNETSPCFVHIADQPEVREILDQVGFALQETFYRNEKFDELPAVKEKSGECRFWVVKK
jgi:ubiquinone/menaquinone biosynthesis C-methylase UbiE